MAQNPDELFDVVDANDVPLRRERRSVVHRERLLHRAVHIFVLNAAGEVYCQRRSLSKDTCPGLLTTSCSGHVDAGEGYDEAAVRELGEELGVFVPDASALAFLFKGEACRETGFEFIRVYKLVWNGELHPDPEETDGGIWLSPSALDARMASEPRAFAPAFRHVWHAARSHGLI